MTDKTKYEAGIDSDARKSPQRIVFLTKKTSAKVQEEVGPQKMAYPHLLMREAIAFQLLMAALVLVAMFWDAPLEQIANPLLTPNPAKAPWYFLGLQELLHYFPPLVAGIIIPTLVIIGLVVIPYFNVNVDGKSLWQGNRTKRLWAFLLVFLALLLFLGIFKAWTVIVPTVIIGILMLCSYFIRHGPHAWVDRFHNRPISWWVMTWFIFVAICLTVVGTFFRGPGWSWVWPWGTHAG